MSGYLPLYASALNPVTLLAAAPRRDGGSRTGQALNVKANSRSNKCDLIIIYFERRRSSSSSVRAWLRLTRVAEPGRRQRLLLFLRLRLLKIKKKQKRGTSGGICRNHSLWRKQIVGSCLDPGKHLFMPSLKK